MNRNLLFICLPVLLLGCGLVGGSAVVESNPIPTSTVEVVSFSTFTSTPMVEETIATDTPTPLPSAMPSPTAIAESTETPTAEPTATPSSEATVPPESNASPPPTDTPVPEAPAAPDVDFKVRYVRMRTNEENSWDGVLGPGQCGSDHSIYVHVGDAQENLLDGVLIGDKFGNFEVPTGVDGPGAVRILVWSATMEVTVTGHQDGTRYTSDFTPPLSTLDEDIPLEWLQQSGYCESPEDCQWRVENNQLCRGHYSYDVIFQRTW